MDRETFESAAREMARERGYVTAALLAKALGLDGAEAKQRLQTMYDGGALELDLEGEAFVYRLKGHTRPLASESPRSAAKEEPARKPQRDAGRADGERAAAKRAEPDEEQDEEAGEGLKEATSEMLARGKTALATAALGALVEDAGGQQVAEEDKKSLLWGVGLGLFLPGLGLFYAAPIVTASLATALVMITVGVLQLIPVLGTVLSYFLFGFFMLTSAVLGGTYTYYFNKTGRRTRLAKAKEGKRALPF